jgi:hypothetical protein
MIALSYSYSACAVLLLLLETACGSEYEYEYHFIEYEYDFAVSFGGVQREDSKNLFFGGISQKLLRVAVRKIHD